MQLLLASYPSQEEQISKKLLYRLLQEFTLACIFGNSIISFWDIDNMTESIVFILIIAVIMLCLFAARIIVARTNREEYEMQKNADKHETEQ